MEKEIGFIGLGKMGAPMVERLKEKGYLVETFDSSGEGTKRSSQKLVASLHAPRRIILMVPHTVVSEAIREIIPFLSAGDTLFDGGNSFYKESIANAKLCAEKQIHFFDVGISGGPYGARNGSCLMIGGKREEYEKNIDLFVALSTEEGYQYVGDSGAGHFVKMVHNGIEYGMMQAIAEGFTLLKDSSFSLSLEKIAKLFSHGSVIDSKLITLLGEGFEEYGEALEGVSGSVAQNGAGAWTSEAASELGVKTPVIDASVEFRNNSEKKPSFTGQILSMLRNRFGGHSITIYNNTQ